MNWSTLFWGVMNPSVCSFPKILSIPRLPNALIAPVARAGTVLDAAFVAYGYSNIDNDIENGYCSVRSLPVVFPLSNCCKSCDRWCKSLWISPLSNYCKSRDRWCKSHVLGWVFRTVKVLTPCLLWNYGVKLVAAGEKKKKNKLNRTLWSMEKFWWFVRPNFNVLWFWFEVFLVR